MWIITHRDEIRLRDQSASKVNLQGYIIVVLKRRDIKHPRKAKVISQLSDEQDQCAYEDKVQKLNYDAVLLEVSTPPHTYLKDFINNLPSL